MEKKTRSLPFLLSGSFFCLDRLLKYLSKNHLIAPFEFVSGLPFGWEPFMNPGIAFGVPIPLFLLITLSGVILLGILFYTLQKTMDTKTRHAFLLLGTGALSNLLDRIFFGATIDYIRLFTAVFNIADVMILTGTLQLFIHWHTKEGYVYQNKRSGNAGS